MICDSRPNAPEIRNEHRAVIRMATYTLTWANEDSTQNTDTAMTRPGQAGSTLKMTASRTLTSRTKPVARRAKCAWVATDSLAMIHHQPPGLIVQAAVVSRVAWAVSSSPARVVDPSRGRRYTRLVLNDQASATSERAGLLSRLERLYP